MMKTKETNEQYHEVSHYFIDFRQMIWENKIT